MVTMTKSQAKQLSPAVLAFYGDSVYEVLVRRKIVEGGNRPSRALHRMSVEMVRASFQSRVFDLLSEILKEEEAEILRRGRNASGLTVPHSSTPEEYHKATAVEALFGYLYLSGRFDRLRELFSATINTEDENENSCG